MAIKVSREFLEKMLDEYNSQVAEEARLVLVKSVNDKTIETESEKEFDTKNLYVCVYDNNCISVFRKICLANLDGSPNIETFLNGNLVIYRGIFSNELVGLGYEDYGAKQFFSWHNTTWVLAGERIHVQGIHGVPEIASCTMHQAVDFESLRSYLKNINKMAIYKPGTATLEEINKVLKHASEYFNLTQKLDKTK